MSTVIETHTDSTDEATRQQLQRWQSEPYIVELLALYQRESFVHPITSSWIMLGRQKGSDRKSSASEAYTHKKDAVKGAFFDAGERKLLFTSYDN